MKTEQPHAVGVLACDGAQLLDIAGPVEVFHQANKFGASYQTTLVGWTGEEVVTSGGARMSMDTSARLAGQFDTLVVCGADDVRDLPQGPGVRSALERLAHPKTRFASICTGAFVLAEGGFLDGARATTHWRHLEMFRRRYPAVEIEPDAIFTRSGRVSTSAGVTSGIDLALALVEDDHGPQLAREAARELVVFLRRPGGQSQFSAHESLPATADRRLRDLVDSVAADPAAPHTVESLAKQAAVSPRHLRRLFLEKFELTPSTFLTRVRIESARRTLEQGASVAEAARTAGFPSDEALRRAFAQTYGITPSGYQQRFVSSKLRVSSKPEAPASS